MISVSIFSLANIYSHLLAYTRILNWSSFYNNRPHKFPRGFLHIELKVILDLRYYSVFGVNLLCMEKRINMQSVSRTECRQNQGLQARHCGRVFFLHNLQTPHIVDSVEFTMWTQGRVCSKLSETTRHVVDTLWTQGRVAGQLANTGWLRFVASTSWTVGATDVYVGLQ